MSSGTGRNRRRVPRFGCASTDTQRGVTMTGSRCTRARIISKERLPAPMTIEARNSTVGMPEARRISPTRSRLRMWAEAGSAVPAVTRPPR